ncbi:MAG: efflux transporter periplasmic adaptor subunit [Rivularia sp. (in: Bacteria)]|nr:efflux transporter periplasmic adaptor subunit [Rivularia sp. MS3]
MEDYSPSTYENSDNRYLEESYQQTAVRELPPQEYQDEENEKVDKPVKEDNKSNKNQIKSALKKYWWIIAVLVVLAGGVTIIRPWESAPEEKNASQVTKFSVRTTKAQRQPIRAWVSSEGRVRAARYKHLTFEVEGDVTYLARRNGRRLREGDRVKSGELLARVDDRKLVADVRQAEAAIDEARKQRAAARANVAQAKAQVSTARSQLQKAQTARNLAATNLERYRLLINEGAIARQEFDTRQNALRDAQADVGAAQSQVQSAQAGVISAQEQLEATSSSITTAEARLTQAKVALEGASIYAPFDGVVAYLNYTEGEYFTPQAVSSQLGGDYQGILERIPMVVIDPSQYEVIVDLAGSTGEQVEPDQTAYVASENNLKNNLKNSVGENTVNQTLVANARAKGEVFAVNPAISPGGRAIEARIRLNPSNTRNVRHGERVLTWIAVEEEPNAIVIPLNTVVYRDQVPYVFIVNREGVVEKRKVGLGIRGITQQQIISGVEAGESVVTQGQNRLVDGAPVRVVSDE